PVFCWTVRSDGTAFQIMRGLSPDRPALSVLSGAPDSAAAGAVKPVHPADWMIYGGEGVRGMEPSLLRLEPWARLYCRRIQSHGESSAVTEEKERVYVLEKVRGLPPELSPGGDRFPFPGNVRRGLSVRLTGSRDAIVLLSTGR